MVDHKTELTAKALGERNINLTLSLSSRLTKHFSAKVIGSILRAPFLSKRAFNAYDSFAFCLNQKGPASSESSRDWPEETSSCYTAGTVSMNSTLIVGSA